MLSGLDRAIALAWSKAQCRVRNVSRVCFDYETYYSGDLCAEFKSRLNDFETSFEEIIKLIDLEDDLGTNTNLGLKETLNDSEVVNSNSNLETLDI